MDNFKLLISDYFDGELDEQRTELLAALLESDPARIDELVFHSMIHFHLAEWMGQRHVLDGVLTGAGTPAQRGMGADAAPVGAHTARQRSAATAPPGVDGTPARGGRPAGRRRLWPLGLAAALLLAASLSLVAYLATSRPVIIAQLTQAQACHWDTSQPDPPVGALLERGQQLRLLEGRALVTFVSGAQIIIEGPASLRLDAPKLAHLEHGRATARVPSPALGFTITSPLARFVDLGTEFTLALGERDFELFVFEGLVEVQFADRSGRGAGPLRISESRAIRFDLQTFELQTLLCEESQRLSL